MTRVGESCECSSKQMALFRANILSKKRMLPFVQVRDVFVRACVRACVRVCVRTCVSIMYCIIITLCFN